jgi:hypothetical protein
LAADTELRGSQASRRPMWAGRGGRPLSCPLAAQTSAPSRNRERHDRSRKRVSGPADPASVARCGQLAQR